MKTLEYYDGGAEAYFAKTAGSDLRELRHIFLEALNGGMRILDFGCGSGRDAKAFAEAGYVVDVLDGSTELCRLACAHTGLEVKRMLFTEFREKDEYDGIWACASILHLQYETLKQVTYSLFTALKENGILYTSFKYGDFEGYRDGRYFTDFNEEKMRRFLLETGGFKLEKLWISEDAIPGREAQKWLNVILRKQGR